MELLLEPVFFIMGRLNCQCWPCKIRNLKNTLWRQLAHSLVDIPLSTNQSVFMLVAVKNLNKLCGLLCACIHVCAQGGQCLCEHAWLSSSVLLFSFMGGFIQKDCECIPTFLLIYLCMSTHPAHKPTILKSKSKWSFWGDCSCPLQHKEAK